MERQDWLLYVISAATPKGLSPVKLQKAMFMLGAEHAREVGGGYYQFRPYDYGPFAADVYGDADTLAAAGLVSIENPLERGRRRYLATTVGIDKAMDLNSAVRQDTRQFISDTLDWIQNLSFPDLVRSIYERYPAFKEKSVFRE